MTDSHDDIKGRMLRHASAIWGVQNIDALDPLVKILVEALAGELQKTHYDIGNFEKRILEKVAQLMTPAILSAPYSAHAIACAQPVDPTHIISQKTHFLYLKKVFSEKESLLNVFFTPAGKVKLFDGHIKYLVSGDKAFMMNTPMQKVIQIKGNSTLDSARSIWIGLKLNTEIENLHNLSFYFDFKNTGNRQALFSIFHLSKWFLGKNELTISKGPSYLDILPKNDLFADFDTMHLIEKEVRHLYDDQFVTISDHESLLVPSENFCKYPYEFNSLYSKSDLANFKDDLLWIKIVTPVLMDEKLLMDLIIAINAFPVLNRRLKDFLYRLKGITNIIPIQTEPFESFLSVDSLRDSSDKNYLQIPFAEDEKTNLGTYSVRKSGTERVDPRASKEYLAYLIELIRDESAAFSSYGQDTVINLVKDLDKLLAQLGQRIRQHKNSQDDAHYYLSVEYPKTQEAFFMDYWINNSFHANGIHAGAKLNLYRGTEIKSDSILLLSTSQGGKGALEPARHMEAYKYAILSHNKIVTVEDIKAFCLFEVGDKIENVIVRKGLLKSENPREGLIRCVEVMLEKKSNPVNSLEDAEWAELIKILESKIELRSALNLKFKLLLKEPVL